MSKPDRHELPTNDKIIAKARECLIGISHYTESIEHISAIVPRALALFVRKSQHVMTLLRWPATCINCRGSGVVDGRTCLSCDGRGYHTA
jgi:hypothetical protein